MSATMAGRARRAEELREVPVAWSAMLRRRIREPVFWRIQAAIAAVTVLHVLLDARIHHLDEPASLALGFHHVPVALYVVPVAYAGLVYGLEGGVLTGAWSALLTSPSIVVRHRSGYEWAGEIMFMLIVMGMGVGMAVPVERERRQRQRAEATARRLTLLNEVAGAAARSHDLEGMVGSVLARLRRDLDLASACAVLYRPGTEEPLVFECDGQRLPCCDGPGPGRVPGDPPVPDSFVEVPVCAEDVTGRLAVLPGPDAPLTDEDRELLAAVGSHLGVVIENALLHRQEREHLQSYVKLVTRAQEEERTRIARDLHDETAQRLVLLCRSLDDLADGGGGSEANVGGMRELAAATLASLRRFAHDLRPAMLDDLGLVPAIEWLVSELAHRTGAETGFEVHGEARRLASEVEVALFRIAQEALRNAEHASSATRIDVEACFDNGVVRLSVRDDGKGFTPPSPSDPTLGGHLGLLGMRERAELVGGTLTIRSAPHQGTAVTASVPADPA